MIIRRKLPTGKSTLTRRNNFPLFNLSCQRAVRIRQQAYLAYINNNNPVNHKSFKKARKLCKIVITRAKRDFIKKKAETLIENKSSGKHFWSFANALKNNFTKPSIPPLKKPDNTIAMTSQEKANFVVPFLQGTQIWIRY